MIFFREILKKRWVNFHNFHTVTVHNMEKRETLSHTVWKFQKFSPTAKILRQIDLKYNSLVKYLIWGTVFKISWGKNLQISTLCLTKGIFRQINSLVTYLVKPLLSRNLCHNTWEKNFHNFHIVLLWELLIFFDHHFFAKLREINTFCRVQ